MLRPQVPLLKAERLVEELVRLPVHLQHHEEVQVQLFLEQPRQPASDYVARVREELREMAR